MTAVFQGSREWAPEGTFRMHILRGRDADLATFLTFGRVNVMRRFNLSACLESW